MKLYKKYVEANLIITDLLWYNEDVLYLVVSNHKYGDKVLVQIGTLATDQLVATIAKKELQEARETWKQVHLSTIVSKRNTVKGLDVPRHDLKWVNGKIHTIKEVVIPPLGTTVVKGIVNLTTHSKCFNVVADQVTGYSEHTATARSYGVLKPGRGKIVVCLRNHTAKQITFPKQNAVREITAAKIIPDLLAPKPTGNGVGEKEATTEKRKTESQKEFVDKIVLTGLGEWSQNEQKEAWKLITEYAGML